MLNIVQMYLIPYILSVNPKLIMILKSMLWKGTFFVAYFRVLLNFSY